MAPRVSRVNKLAVREFSCNSVVISSSTLKQPFEVLPETHYSPIIARSHFCSDIASTIGMTMIGRFITTQTSWVKALLKLADNMEREDWGDDTIDSDGNKKTTSSQYAIGKLSATGS